jgi:hypothetical protein
MSLERSDTEIITPSVISSQDVSRMASGISRISCCIICGGYFADNEASQASLGSSLNLSRNLTTSLATIEYESGGDEEKEEESSRPAKRKRGEDTGMTSTCARLTFRPLFRLDQLQGGHCSPE